MNLQFKEMYTSIPTLTRNLLLLRVRFDSRLTVVVLDLLTFNRILHLDGFQDRVSSGIKMDTWLCTFGARKDGYCSAGTTFIYGVVEILLSWNAMTC